MAVNELPSMAALQGYSTTSVSPTSAGGWVDNTSSVGADPRREAIRSLQIGMPIDFGEVGADDYELKDMIDEEEDDEMSSFRLARVFIVDPDDRLPLDKRVLYAGPEITTDLTDQELFFEVEIKDRLDKHNVIRKDTVDKETSKSKDKDVFLEPIRIRDLKMVVVTLAQF